MIQGKFVLLPSPACGTAEGSLRSNGVPTGVLLAGEGAGGEGAHWNMRFLQGLSLSLTLNLAILNGQGRWGGNDHPAQ